MAEAFRECKYVMIILDEAALCTDPALWNLVVRLFKPEHLEAEHAGSTHVQAVVLVGDHDQGKAVIKSEVVCSPIFTSSVLHMHPNFLALCKTPWTPAVRLSMFGSKLCIDFPG